MALWYRRNRAWAIVALLAAAGCRWAPPPAGTGAHEAVQGFYEALLQQDWPRAYAALHPDSRAHASAEQFARLATQYRRNLGFEPERVQVRSCEEHGAEAVAHVVFTSRTTIPYRSYKDGIALRRSATDWGVVLPPHFGRVRAR
jgi:hypothetical protein